MLEIVGETYFSILYFASLEEVPMFFENVLAGPPDAIFGMASVFKADLRKDKINLMVGVYKDEHLQSSLLTSVQLAKEKILPKDQLADYLTFQGLPEYSHLLGELIFGSTLWAKEHSRIYGAQSLGGTGALRIGAEFLAQEVGCKVYIPQPTWGNHRNIFERAGFQVENLPYYSQVEHGFDADGYLNALRLLERGSVVVCHAACHNPTGSDPTFAQWKQISAVCRERGLLPFFDFAYQGFGLGLEADAAVVRLFLENGHEMLIAYSCSKNFSLYSQRVGALFVVCPNTESQDRVASQVNRIIRAMYSNPPAHGARIVAEILGNEALFQEWAKEVEQMRLRIVEMHKNLSAALMARCKTRDFSFLQHRKGMFSYLDLSKSEVQSLIDKFGIYTLDSGRISVAGLTSENIEIVANNVAAVCNP